MRTQKRSSAFGWIIGTLISGMVMLAPARAEDADGHAAHVEAAQATPDETQQGMRGVEALMDRIAAATDDGQRSELLAQHLMALRTQMRVIRTAAAGKAAPAESAASEDPHAGHQAASDKPAEKARGGMMERKMKGGGMMKMHKQVEQRLEMLERMLQQLIEHEAVERALERD